jgi:tetratricopeptide (TPR) repeat protein
MPCPTTNEFADYLAGDQTHQSHVAGCARCSAIATALRLVWSVEDVDAVIAEVERREAIASAAVAELEGKLPFHWCASARVDERLHSPEGVRRLLQRAAETYGITPRRALALCRAAVTCAVVGTVEPDLTFSALKDVATYSLRAADDLAGALAALDAAEMFVPLTNDPTSAAAVLAYARAYVYGSSMCAQWERALAFLDRCEGVFADRDLRRWRASRHLRAAVLLRRSDYGRAAELYRGLLDEEPDRTARARLSNDLAECYSRAGRAAEALPSITDALAVLREMGDPIELARGMWTYGTALSGAGFHDGAIRVLEAARHAFATSGLNDDELGAELSLIRAVMARDPGVDVTERLEQAYMLASALDATQPLRSTARRAELWAALRRSYEQNKLTDEILTHASEYLRTLGRGDEVPYAPLQ